MLRRFIAFSVLVIGTVGGSFAFSAAPAFALDCKAGDVLVDSGPGFIICRTARNGYYFVWEE